MSSLSLTVDSLFDEQEAFRERWNRKAIMHHRWFAWLVCGGILLTLTIIAAAQIGREEPAYPSWLPALMVFLPLPWVIVTAIHYVMEKFCRLLVGDIPAVSALTIEQPLLPIATVRTIVLRRRLWRGMLSNAYWLAGELVILGITIAATRRPGMFISGWLSSFLLLAVIATSFSILMRLAAFILISYRTARRPL